MRVNVRRVAAYRRFDVATMLMTIVLVDCQEHLQFAATVFYELQQSGSAVRCTASADCMLRGRSAPVRLTQTREAIAANTDSFALPDWKERS